ncbi:MAG: DUF541 domain-containing protein [Sphingobacteriales bacterium]|nr:MAG: DUF541 domain-containing protein [Sphingobacteriales bacterium]
MKAIKLSILALLLAGSVQAQQIIVDKKPPKYIRVSGHAEKFYEPDYVDVQINLEEKEKVNTDNSVAEKERALLDFMKANNIPAEKLRVQRLNTGEAYALFGSKYYIRKNYTLRIDDLSRYENIILGLVGKGFKNLYVSDISINNKDKRNDEVMADAVKNGSSKANVIATAAGIKSVKLVSVDETGNSNPMPIMYKRMAMSAEMSDANNIALDKISLQKDVEMVFEIE